MRSETASLNEEWREFLNRDLDARRVVDGIMSRTGFEQDEVLVYLLEAWAERNVVPDEQSQPSDETKTLRFQFTPSVALN
jgi:hypothetical protein